MLSGPGSRTASPPPEPPAEAANIRLLRPLFAAALSLALLAPTLGCDRYDEDGIFVRTGCDEQRVARIHPMDGGTTAFAGGWIMGQLACTAPEATLTVRSQANRAVEGAVTRHLADRQLRLRPTEPLAPNSTYIALIETDDGDKEWDFVTTATGTAVGTELAGITTAMDAAGGVLLDPAGVGPALSDEVAAMRAALELRSDADADGVQARLGAWTGEVDSGTQDFLRPTAELLLTWDDPFFQSAPQDLRWRLVNFTLVLEDAVIGGGVLPGAESLDGFWMGGRWDTRGAQAALGDLCAADRDADGAGCVPCRDGEEQCLAFLLVAVPQVDWPASLMVQD